MITTTGDLITFALRASGINGIGQTPSAEDANTALDLMRMILAQWQRKRWLAPALAETVFTATGAASYTLASRQTTLYAAYARQLPAGVNPLDFPLGIIESREDYSAIGLKSLSTFPAVAFLDTAHPTAHVYVWPIPAAGSFELHFVFPQGMPITTTLADNFDLPLEYMEALMWSLCVRLQMAYGLPARPDHVAAMHQALNVVQVANTQVSLLAMPGDLPGRRGGTSVAAGSSTGFLSGGMAW